MKLIGISQRTCVIEKFKETRDCIDQRWYQFFLKLKMTPILLPNCISLVDIYLSNFKFDGFLLSGGNSSLLRSEVESKVLNFSIEQKIPLMGVCHGMQVIQELYGLKLKTTPGHISEKEKIIFKGKKRIVNSYHKYGTVENVSKFEVWGYSLNDQVIKSIKHVNLPIFGIMWHPERNDLFEDEDISLFKAFYNGEI